MDELRRAMVKGQFDEVITGAKELIGEDDRAEDARLLLADAYMEKGQLEEAQATIAAALRRNVTSVRLRLLGYHAFRQGGNEAQSQEYLAEINEYGGSRRWLYRDAVNLVALGRAALILGAEPRVVLEGFFDVAKQAEPKLKDVYLAAGQLALDKGDDALASRTFNEGLREHTDDPDLLAGLAQSFAETDRQQMLKMIQEALKVNPKHQRSLLLMADHLIDAEEYEEAEKALTDVLSVNPHRPEAWAYRAVIAHLRNKTEDEKAARERALRRWAKNPLVDHLIGLQLSQKYRFKEGAEYQRMALAADPAFVPAKIQLSQDLLRLGNDNEGWKFAHEAHEEDAYDTIAYNLVTLHDNTKDFAVVADEHFRIRMSQKEAAIYGKRVLALLNRAREVMVTKYGAEIHKPTIVEIFPEQKDFAIRTFSMPGGVGYLGVCFGTVITANSPAAHKGNAINWESMLWHEFCHVVTLQMTKNKMPRWLSEGISVYEEHLADPSWGEQLSPEYRELILKEEMPLLSQLSSAFMAPKTPMHLQFAYYQSYLTVKYLAERFGMPSIQKILKDLGDGVEINVAIERHTEEMSKLEKAFIAYAKEHADTLAPGLDFSKPKLGVDLSTMIDNNYYKLQQQAAQLYGQDKFEEAIEPLRKLIELYPRQTGPNSAHAMLSAIYRRQDKRDEEKKTLARWAEVDCEALDAFSRLMDLALEDKNWTAALKHADRFLAVNPLLLKPYEVIAEASHQMKKSEEAVRALETALVLDPPDPVALHFKTAQILSSEKPEIARMHLVQALEEAPRFRQAHALLRELSQRKSAKEAEVEELKSRVDPPPAPPRPAPEASPRTN